MSYTRRLNRKSTRQESKVSHIPDNPLSTFLSTFIQEMIKGHDEYVYEKNTNAVSVVLDKETHVIWHTITYPDGSHIRFCATGSDRVDISRVWISPENQGKGLGTQLMNIVMGAAFAYYETTLKTPKMYLECIGGVGYGENFQRTPVLKQVKFFNKFGFTKVSKKNLSQYAPWASERKAYRLNLSLPDFLDYIFDIYNLSKEQ